MLHYTILFEPIGILHCVDSCTLTILRHMILIIYIYIYLICIYIIYIDIFCYITSTRILSLFQHAHMQQVIPFNHKPSQSSAVQGGRLGPEHLVRYTF